MTTYDIKRLALVLAIQAEIEGMKAKNLERTSEGMTAAWPESHFSEAAEELRTLASKHDEQL